MATDEVKFDEYVKSMTSEQKQECLEIIRKNNQGILAKDFIMTEMPGSMDTDVAKGHVMSNFLQSLLKKAVVL